MKKLLIVFFLLPVFLFSQERLSGTIYEDNIKNKKLPLPGANVYWLNSSIGVITDSKGKFTIPLNNQYNRLVISYIGFKSDTINVDGKRKIEHWLRGENNLDEVVLNQRKKTTSVSYLKSLNMMTMTKDELLKAACCNLCESFETNPSIDVNFADAITGTKQIKMLGLTSPYILTAIESVPAIRGASQTFGLSFIPGTWVESIQITKGAGSVINGFESISGQINAKLQKPVKDHKLFVNTYVAGNGRVELNTHFNTKLNDKLFTGLYVHGNKREKKYDKNGDSFLDMPLAEQINIMNRWQYTDLEKGIVSFLDVRLLKDEKQLGQTGFNAKTNKYSTDYWGSEIDTRRFDISGKFSYQNPELTHQTIDLLTTFSTHKQDSYFGQNLYNIKHNSLYVRGVFGSILTNTKNKIKAGVNYTLDEYTEAVGDYLNATNYGRNENSIGLFFEYNYDDLEDFNVTAGMRVDHHNLLGTFLTPRLHARYTLWEQGALRASVGRGKRSANIFAENQNIFATSRNLNILNTGGDIYGLDPEIAWNFGVSFLQGFNLFEGKGDFVFDFYRTDFENQIVVDWENPQEVSFYNLDGDSYANSFQFEFNYSPVEVLSLRFAYKYYDVKTQYKSGKLEKPLTPKQRFFANASWETKKTTNNAQWKFDLTYNWLGRQRYPSTIAIPIPHKLEAYSSTVGTINTQVTKVFSSSFEIYAGGENILNTKQSNPILGANDPFGDFFDTTFVYGPIFGSTYYAGLRFNIN